MDNFEWLEGETTDFGLYNATSVQERTARKSAELYADICKNKGLRGHEKRIFKYVECKRLIICIP